jgi:aminoglycoside phosphotransferase (APT) family kinase protein
VPKVHPDEIDVDARVVRRLLAAQFPHWADLPLRRFPSYGTDNVLFRLGEELYVRLPRLRRDNVPEWAIAQIDKEAEWLPRLGPLLPIEVPAPLAQGEPDKRYPHRWAVYHWLEGGTPRRGTARLARDVATFLAALHAADTTGAPPALSRARPLEAHDQATRAALEQLHGEIDVATATARWEHALEAPPWDGAPVWVHGDMLKGNLLVRHGRLAAVLDWGSLCAGDPACDYMLAWSLFAQVRDEFRATSAVDDATWARARGWALSQAVIALPYYLPTNPPMVRHARSAIAGVLADCPVDCHDTA